MSKSLESLTIVSWNVKDGMAGDSRANAITDRLLEINSDITFLSEASSTESGIKRRTIHRLEQALGAVCIAPYADSDNRPDKHTMMMVTKPDCGTPEVKMNRGRNGLYLSVPNTKLMVAAYHGYDRDDTQLDNSEHLRVKQVEHIISRFDAESPETDGCRQDVVIGDMNSMHSDQPMAKVLRQLRPFVDRLPTSSPGQPTTRIRRIGSLSQRLSRMASGGPIREFEMAGFKDADRSRSATMRIGPLGVQLDHIMTRNVNVSDITVENPEGLSDHALLIARIVLS